MIFSLCLENWASEYKLLVSTALIHPARPRCGLSVMQLKWIPLLLCARRSMNDTTLPINSKLHHIQLNLTDIMATWCNCLEKHFVERLDF